MRYKLIFLFVTSWLFVKFHEVSAKDTVKMGFGSNVVLSDDEKSLILHHFNQKINKAWASDDLENQPEAIVLTVDSISIAGKKDKREALLINGLIVGLDLIIGTGFGLLVPLWPIIRAEATIYYTVVRTSKPSSNFQNEIRVLFASREQQLKRLGKKAGRELSKSIGGSGGVKQ